MSSRPGHDERPPAAVLAAYGFSGTVEPIAGGLINATYLVRDPAGAPAAIVQRLHPIFAAEVNLDIDVVTAHLARRGLATPRLLRTIANQRWLEREGKVWRAITYVDGVTLHAVRGPADAEGAGQLAGQFHRALADLDHDFAFTRAGVHDTAAHLARLSHHLATATTDEEGADLGHDIIATADRLRPLAAAPPRAVHGDMKISNVRFMGDGSGRALAWIDLDTLGHQLIAHELGDALRSWCNPGGEDSEHASFDLDIFAAAMRGYAAAAGDLLSPGERADIVAGIETICVELAARFAVDVFADSYFGWDAQRYPSRRAHNLLRARGQLALARSLAAERNSAEEIVADLLGAGS